MSDKGGAMDPCVIFSHLDASCNLTLCVRSRPPLWRAKSRSLVLLEKRKGEQRLQGEGCLEGRSTGEQACTDRVST